MKLFYFVGANFSMRNFVETQTGNHKPVKHGGRGKLKKDFLLCSPSQLIIYITAANVGIILIPRFETVGTPSSCKAKL